LRIDFWRACEERGRMNYEFGSMICTERDEKGKMKKEKGIGKKAAGASIRPDESGLLSNRLLPARPQTATHKAPPLRGATGGKHRNKPPKNPDYWLLQIPQIFAEKNLRQSA